MIQLTTEIKHQVVVSFYVKEDTNSPYQGVLFFTQEEFAKLGEDDLKAKQVEQFDAWKAGLVAMQEAAKAAENEVPASITLSQAHAVILEFGLKDKVEAVVAAADKSVQDLWYTSANIERADPMLNTLAKTIGLTQDQLDEMFRRARDYAVT